MTKKVVAKQMPSRTVSRTSEYQLHISYDITRSNKIIMYTKQETTVETGYEIVIRIYLGNNSAICSIM